MRDLVFGLDVQTIGQRPYKSIPEHECLEGQVQYGMEVGTRQLGLVASARGALSLRLLWESRWSGHYRGLARM
ncbi:MAG: hypothetical protein CM1200mP2_40660 [Planctomycetaceae bacterium]|nr:MAG: hypothetical protein CM1200mP2_40660 [Planctomycetaceae bacterium]